MISMSGWLRSTKTTTSKACDLVLPMAHRFRSQRVGEDFDRGFKGDAVQSQIAFGLGGIPFEARLHLSLLYIHECDTERRWHQGGARPGGAVTSSFRKRGFTTLPINAPARYDSDAGQQNGTLTTASLLSRAVRPETYPL